MPFTHLHVHTEYSLLDGAAKIDALMDKCVREGMDSIAITDHGVMYGAVNFYKAAKKRNIKPIIGCEVYVAPRSLYDKEAQDREPAHLVLLCETEEGYHNLCKLVSMGFVDGFYYRPRIDYDVLAKHARGLIGLSACLAGDIQRLLMDGNYDGARNMSLKLRDILGEGNFYLELQDHGISEQRNINPLIVQISEETGIPLVATNDVHYVEQSDAPAQDILLCIQTQKTVNDGDRMRFETEEFFLKTPEEMERLFSWRKDALENTAEIAKRCNVSFQFGVIHLPNYEVPDGRDHLDYLRSLCLEGMARKYPPNDPAASARLDYELSVIQKMGYVDYFLIVQDFVNYSKGQDIMVGPGRGSAAGSLVAYCLNITELDPLKYDLLFERFLNPERISMPDIDIDFCYERRQEVIDYVIRKYGSDHVAQIITFGTMAARAVIRDVGRALNMSYGDVDKIAKLIPNELGINIEKALERSSELRELAENDEGIGRLIDMSRRLEGLPRHASTHAAGVVISKLPLTEHVPLNRNNDAITTQYPMGNIEELGLLKMDFLGLRNLTAIQHSVEMVERSRGVRLDIHTLPVDDPEVYKLISSGDTDGVFQLESAGMRAFMKELRPTCFEDIMAGISLYRPGPMDSIPRYIEGKRNASSLRYEHPILERILKETYGCMVYQEQVMQIVRDMAGYSLGRSDLVRRAMAKKKMDVMVQERQYFIYGMEKDGKVEVPGAIRLGVPEAVAAKIFDQMYDFANYAFNKPHAAAYALVAYWTAWLKTYYPAEFMAALMNSVAGSAEKVAVYVQYCRKNNIPMLPPDINNSEQGFTVADGGIRFGLAAIKNAGEGAVDQIIALRKQQPFVDFVDFLYRTCDIANKRMVESLIKAGAFDGLGIRRSQAMACYEKILDGVARERKNNVQGQLSLFEQPESGKEAAVQLPDIPELPRDLMLKMEKEMTGIYITGHPLSEYEKELAGFSVNTSLFEPQEEGENGESAEALDGRPVSLGGMIVGRSIKATRNNKTMAFLTLEDMYGTAEIIVFPNIWERSARLLETDAVVVVNGRISARENEAPKVVADSIAPLTRQAGPGKLYIKLPSGTKSFARKVFYSVLHQHHGEAPVYMLDETTGKKFLLGEEYAVRIGDELLGDLGELLGQECVKTGR